MASMNTLDLSARIFQERQADEASDRLKRYKRAWDYYHGEHDKPLPVRMGQPDDNVILNYTRYIIDKSVAFLFGKDPTFELEEGAVTPDEEWLEEFWRRNHKMTFLAKLGMMGSLYGHIFVKIIPDGREDGYPRLVLLEPENMTVFWLPQDIEDVWRYVFEIVAEGRDGEDYNWREIIERDEGDRWQVMHRIAKGKSSGDWREDPDNPDIAWPYDWPPIVTCQNIPCAGAYYGLSDIEDLDEQDAINYLASKVQRILRYHAHPKTIGKGFRPGDVRVTEDDMIVLPSMESDVHNLEMQSDLSAALGFMMRMVDTYMTTTRAPRIDPATMNIGAMSGFALRVLLGDTLEKNSLKQRTYGDLLTEINRRVLEIHGAGAENFTTIHWPDPLPDDEQAMMTGDKFELDYNLVSKETVRNRRGLNDKDEKERIAAEKEEAQEQNDNLGAAIVRNWQNAQGNIAQRTQQPVGGQQQEQAEERE